MVAELPVVVEPPGVHVAVAADGQRMVAAGIGLHVGEIHRCACRLWHRDGRVLLDGRAVAELAIPVLSPCVGVPVAAHSQRIPRQITIYVSSATDLVEPDAASGYWWGDGGGFLTELAALVGVDSPGGVGVFAGPFGGEGEILGDGPAEIVGDVAGEPSVELVAFARRVGGGALDSAVDWLDVLVLRGRASFARVEMDCIGGALLDLSGQGLVDRVAEASGEGLIALFSGDSDDGLLGSVGGHVRLPGILISGEVEWLAVQAGCFQDGRLDGVGLGWFSGLALGIQVPSKYAALPVNSGDPAAGSRGLHVNLSPVVRADGRLA